MAVLITATGPTVLRSYVFPDANATMLTSAAAVTAAQGGTGVATLAAHGVLVGNGTGAVAVTGAGTAGHVLTSNGASADPTFQAAGFSGVLNALLDLSGASAGQIKFPATQNASSNVNTLDDYEEGTFTPVIGGAGGTSGQTYSVQLGRYVKIGKEVCAVFCCSLSAKGTITGSVEVQGLPFTIENITSQQYLVAFFFDGLATNWTSLYGLFNPNTTAGTVRGSSSPAASTTVLTTTDIANTSVLRGVLAYAATA